MTKARVARGDVGTAVAGVGQDADSDVMRGDAGTPKRDTLSG